MKLSIRVVLIGAVVGLQIATVGAILFSSSVTNQQVLLKHARQLMDGVAKNTIDRSQQFLSPAQAAADLTRRLVDHGILSGADLRSMERYFHEQLRLYPQFAGMYLGTIEGDFYYVNRSSDAVAGGFRTKTITHRGGERRVEMVWRTSGFDEVKRALDPADTYDPRTRPWFRKSLAERRLIWTDPYVFFTSRQPGITVASPVVDADGNVRGAVGVDIEITDISTFLGQIRDTTGVSAFILNHNGDVIAHPDVGKIRRPADAGESFRFTRIDELDDPAARAAYASLGHFGGSLQLDAPAFSTFESGGQRHHAVFSPYPSGIWPWVIVVHLPEDFFLGELKRNQMVNIWIAVAIATFASLVGLAIARAIGRPMARLRAEAQAITSSGLASGTETPIFSPIEEVDEAAKAFRRMVASLQQEERRNNELTDRLRLLSRVVEEGPAAVLITDAEGRIEYVNQRFTEISGYTLEEVRGSTPRILKSPETPAEVHARLWAAVKAGEVWHGEIQNRRKGGENYWTELTIAPLRNAEGKVTRLIGISEDISARKAAEEELERRVEERTAALREEIAERQRMELALREAKELADDANEAKSRFLSSMSHELRTPMNAILGFGQLLEIEKETLNDEQREYVHHINESGRHLLDLINQVLELARIEEGRLALAIEDVDAGQVLAECLAIATVLCQKHGLRLVRAASCQTLPAVRADSTRLKQILLNLLSNAVKYNRPGGSVTLACSLVEDGRFLRFGVSDTGEGIAEQHRPLLFKPFTRFSAAQERVEGTGIGLAITRQLVELMEGRIGFDTELGVGSTFWFDLPLAGTAAAPSAQPAEAVAIPAALPRRASVLYVEDSPANLRLMQEVLARLGNCTLISATGAEEGLALVSEHRPDLVLMDINLPQMDGYAALAALRADPATRSIPVVALTANAMPGESERALAAGFSAYVTKPFVVGRLVELMASLLEGKGVGGGRRVPRDAGAEA